VNLNHSAMLHGRLTILYQRSNTLEQILDVLRGSTIAEELGKDVESKFWATYKKASNDHDGDFLERANDDMGIILTFVRSITVAISASLTRASGWFIFSCQFYLHC
jgi:hypothetical protein